jgi:tetratricopeptide (TPR) repeat protein
LRLRLPGAWLAAAIFALHPVQVESVAWVTERKNVLSAVFYFASALAYLRFSPLLETEAPSARRWKWFFLALAFFVAALLSKTVTCSLPVALLLARWWKTGHLRWADAGRLLPFFLAGAGLGGATAWLERHHVGAEGPEWALTLDQRLLLAGRVLWFYAHQLVWPESLTFIYPRWQLNAATWWQWLFPAATVGLLAALWIMRFRIGRGPLAAVLYFAATLGPALGFVNVYPMRYSFVADHFQYLGSIGLIAPFSAWASRWPRWTLGLLLAVLAVLTWQQSGIYRDSQSLWRATLANNPNCWLAWNNIGLDSLRKGDSDTAMRCFEKSIEINPHDPEAIYNLGNAHLQKAELEPAATQYRRALALKPSFPEAQSNLGNTLFQLGQTAEAIQHWQRAVELEPSNAAALNNLAWVLATCPIDPLRDGARAVALAQRAAQLTGSANPRVLRTLAAAYAEAGRFAEAVQTAQGSLQLARAEGDAALSNDLETQIKLHQAGSPLHGASRMKP